MNDMKGLTSELVKTRQFYKWSEIAIANNFQDHIFIVNKAYPNKPPLNIIKMVLVGIFASVLAISTVCVILYLYHYLRKRVEVMLAEI